jgi:hypothetical protein
MTPCTERCAGHVLARFLARRWPRVQPPAGCSGLGRSGGGSYGKIKEVHYVVVNSLSGQRFRWYSREIGGVKVVHIFPRRFLTCLEV